MSTPLHEASRYGHVAVAKVLVENGADINNKDNFGRTPRDLAVSHGHAGVVALLDKAGAKAGADQNPSKGTPIRLVLVDGASGERHETDIFSSAALRGLFRRYAEERGLPLRSLRFLHNGRTLFLSGGAGNKSPDQLNMKDRDVIIVHNTHRETSGDSTASKSSASKPKTKKARPKSARTRARGKGNQKQTQQEKPEKTLEEHKAEHSKALSRLHEEVGPRLKEIRTRLNALDLERQPPKQRKKNNKKKSAVGASAGLPRLPDAGVGGRAGRSAFVVNVGDVQNLYRTTKAHQSSPSKFELDLHGHSREGALARLDESLVAWVDAAMRGSYPFTVQVTIICGCGNQILEETVETWIRTTRNVGNAPNRALR